MGIRIEKTLSIIGILKNRKQQNLNKSLKNEHFQKTEISTKSAKRDESTDIWNTQKEQ